MIIKKTSCATLIHVHGREFPAGHAAKKIQGKQGVAISSFSQSNIIQSKASLFLLRLHPLCFEAWSGPCRASDTVCSETRDTFPTAHINYQGQDCLLGAVGSTQNHLLIGLHATESTDQHLIYGRHQTQPMPAKFPPVQGVISSS